jgi:Caspase domain/N-acetylmuramoyl-L-alanine amidase
LPGKGENHMLGFISELTIEQMLAALAADTSRKITAVHIHHTWRPTAGQWWGKQTVEAMRRVHMEERGWNDIAQHLTIGPDGSLWSGRALAAAPASALGHNGNASEGPFMIEMVGDFDSGRDPFCAPQSDAVYRVAAFLCLHFSLRAQDVRFHREFNAAKSCPGTQLALEPFRTEIVKAMAAEKKGYDAWKKSRSAPLPAIYASARSQARFESITVESGAEIAYSAREAAAWDASLPRGFFDRKPNPADQAVFDRHVVNLTMGRLSDTGIVQSSPESLDALIGYMDAWAKSVANPRIVFYAHGGLVSEKAALDEVVRPQVEWWVRHGVYPVFFVWESGIFEVLGRHAPQDNAERGVFEKGAEFITGPVARDAWRAMKTSAFMASQPLIADGSKGGAYIFAEKIIHWLGRPATPTVGLHAVAHSAGAIFLGEWLPMLIANYQNAELKKQPKNPIETLSFLAPACTIAYFKEKLITPIRNKEITSFAEFTMKVGEEQRDTLFRFYQGSLLYYVRNACEPECAPLLGLQESLLSDPELTTFFALKGGVPEADIAFSKTAQADGRFATQALTHGDFDNDPATMNSVLRRILNLPTNILLPDALTTKRDARIAGSLPPRAATHRALSARTQSSTRVYALCIGIDDYPDKPLSGCVADAKLWADTLRLRGAIVHATLHNAAATKRGIVDAWQAVCARAQYGDTVVIQYAGHGTQVPDTSGDEKNGLDQAWVPYDYESGHALVDDEIGGLIDSQTPDGVSLVLITDCCNSASNTRAKSATLDNNSKSRFLRLENKPAFVEKFAKTNARWTRELRARGERAPEREIHFAGCQDDQSSFESNGNGAFTLAAVAALNALHAGGLYSEWALAIREQFAANGPQVPNFKALSSDAQRPVFSNAAGGHAADGDERGELAQVLKKLSVLEAHVASIKVTLDKLV